MNQFYYTRKQEIKPKKAGETSTFEDRLDSFNIDMVIRTILQEDGNTLVALNDFHPEKREEPIFNKQRKFSGDYKWVENTYQSNIVLLPADAERFRKMTDVNQSIIGINLEAIPK